MRDAANRQEFRLCPECGWKYGRAAVVPSHTAKVKWGAPEMTWFGGYGGAIAFETGLLHLVQDDGTTFCLNPGILTAATDRSLGNVSWCDVCVRECQKVRRDV